MQNFTRSCNIKLRKHIIFFTWGVPLDINLWNVNPTVNLENNFDLIEIEVNMEA